MKNSLKIFSTLLCLMMLVMMIPAAAKAATANIFSVEKTDTDGNPLAGAVFTLTGIDNSIGQNYEATSDENGIAEFNVADGRYELAEAIAPYGYEKSDDIYKIYVSEGNIYLLTEIHDELSPVEYETITYVNQKIPPCSLSVKKTDKDGNPLAGAIFTLTGTGNYIGHDYEAVSGDDGIAVFETEDGYYILSEKSAPEGYIKSDKTYDIAVFDGTAHFYTEGSNDTVYTDYETVVYVNEKEPTCAFTVKKTDKNGNSLAGAVFSLTGTGNYIGHNYEAVSGADGIASFDVNDGYYTLAEKSAPEGYIKSDKTYDIAVFDGKVHFYTEGNDGTTYTDYETVVFINEMKQSTPQTGDSKNSVFWITLLLASAGVLTCTALVSKKNK